jgi:hypothetical protein
MIEAGGLINFVRAVRFAARYGAACRDAKKAGEISPLTITEYAKRVGMTRDHCYREQRAWRSCCGDVNVLEVIAEEMWTRHVYSLDQVEAAIARQLLEDQS